MNHFTHLNHGCTAAPPPTPPHRHPNFRGEYNPGMSSSVFVLGAGASKHVGYPLIATMGSELIAWMSSRDEFRGTAEFLSERFGPEPNIEDVITELDRRITLWESSGNPEERNHRAECAHYRGNIRTAVPMWFREIRTRPITAYATFADHVVRPGDTVITFNYDDSLERELKRAGKWDIGQGYGFAIGNGDRASPVTVLKPHGSINWLVSIFGGVRSGFSMMSADGPLGKLPCIATDDLLFLGYPDMQGTFPGGGGFPSLILPGRTKEFYYPDNFGKQHEEFFNNLWSQAEAAVGRADRVVLCGYGMAEADQRACDLLLGVPPKDTRAEIVCGPNGQDIAARFRSAGFADVHCFAEGFFEAWVNSVSSTT